MPKANSALPSLIFILFLALSPAYALQPSFINGNVFSAYDNSLIRGATVSTTSGISTETSSSGSFRLRVPPNVYDIIVSATGYSSNLCASVLAPPGQSATFNIRLFPTSAATGNLQGRVLALKTGKAVHGALILTDLGGIEISGSNGNFSISIPAGYPTVTVSANGFSSKIVDDLFIATDTTKYIVIYLEESPSATVLLSGIIKDRCTGSFINDAFVISKTNNRAVSENNGSYMIQSPPRLTTLLASAKGYQFSYRNLSLTNIDHDPMLNFEMVSSNSSQIKGTVTNLYTLEPLEGVKLETNTGFISFTNQDGNYKLYTSSCTTQVTAYKNGFEKQQIPISVTQGIPLTLNISLTPLATISGTVSDVNDNHTICDADIFLEEQQNISAISRDDGNYYLDNIHPDQYGISVFHRCYDSDKRTVSIGPGESLQENFLLTPHATGSLQGFVFDGITGDPIKSARIITDHCAEAKTDENGFYSILLPACQTLITVEADRYITQTDKIVYIENNKTSDYNAELVPCPIAGSLKNNQTPDSYPLLNLFRNYRDEVLNKDIIIAEYVRIFYDNAYEISSILHNNPGLKTILNGIIIKLYIILNINSSYNSLTIDERLAEEIYFFMEQFQQEISSTKFYNEMQRFLLDFKKGIIFELLGINQMS